MRALVVGASGMLTEVARWLAEQSYQVIVVGRNRAKLERVRDGSRYPHLFTLLPLDYGQTDQLREAMEQLIAEQGHIELVVAWINSTAPEAISTIQQVLSRPKKKWSLYHVCGSRAWIHPPLVQEVAGCSYHRIILGFVCEEKGSRWLNNEEIAQGVIFAIQSKEPQTIVGSVEPWEKRPT
ncbi:short-chain dehydrogenase [Brevibacillus reuszeri]|uniref:short-chain dehydrogenase n=1 Tax=Brevibacillus reuszeri TaxID=54915 RepID=UPI001B23D877|nr:short-chain dehydrogenase [Brevibacillus reuszeri]GIO04972.1 short-chain dehydrogenase [Brevibacillus reuszeri]